MNKKYLVKFNCIIGDYEHIASCIFDKRKTEWGYCKEYWGISKKDELKEENIYLWIKKQLEEEPKKTFNSSYINSLRHKEMKLSEEEFKELSKMNNLKAERLRFAK